MSVIRKKKDERNERDCYLTPKSMVRQFIEVEEFDKNKTVLECCANKEKTIEEVLRQEGFKEIKSNVFEMDGIDFLQWDENDKYDYIISNTPYLKSNDFILKCMRVARYKICLLYPLDYLNGIYRYENIFNNQYGFKLKCVYNYTRKAMLEEKFIDTNGEYYRTGLGCYCWFIFEKDYQGDTILKMINNNKYVLGSKDCSFRYDNKTKTIKKM